MKPINKTINTAVLLTTATGDLGVVPADQAQAEATETAQRMQTAVTLRDPTTDAVIGVVEPVAVRRRKRGKRAHASSG